MRYDVILLGAGDSLRASLGYNKMLYKINGVYVILKAASNFLLDERVNHIFITCRQSELADFKEIFKEYKNVYFILGGNSRTHSIKNVFDYLKDSNYKSEYILIHDGARPFVSKELIDKILDNLVMNDAVIPGIKVNDTILEVDNDSFLSNCLERENLRAIQTPQGFKYETIQKAYMLANKSYSDDSLLLYDTLKIKSLIIKGEISNIKLTNKEDFDYEKICKN